MLVESGERSYTEIMDNDFELRSREIFGKLSTAALADMLTALDSVPDSEKSLHKDFTQFDIWMREELFSRQDGKLCGGYVRFYRAHPFMPGSVKFEVPDISQFDEEWLSKELLSRFNENRDKLDRPTTADLLDVNGKQILKLFAVDPGRTMSSPTDKVGS